MGTRSRRGRRIPLAKARARATRWRAACWRRSPAAAAAVPPGRGRGAAPPGGLLAAIAGRGRGRGGLGAALTAPRKKKPKTLSSAKAALVKARSRAAADAARLPVQLPEFGIVEATTAPVVDALQDENDDDQSHAGKARRASATILKCDAAAAAASAALALLRETAKAARREGDRLRTNLRDVEGALDVWRARERDAPNRAAKLAEEEREWSRREEAANAAALALIRTLVPLTSKGDTVEGLRHRAARWWPRRRPRRSGGSVLELCGYFLRRRSVTASAHRRGRGRHHGGAPRLRQEGVGDCGGLGRLLHVCSRREIEERATAPLGPGAPRRRRDAEFSGRRRRGLASAISGDYDVVELRRSTRRVPRSFNQCVGCTVLAPSSGEEPASPRHRRGVTSSRRRV